jgi:protein-S-isoprenylcysteine O-methyltransferase Ste14
MWLLSYCLPQFQYKIPAGTFVASALAIAGAVISAAGVYSFRRARTTVNPLRPDSTTSLVVSGVYSISRNPMYVGFVLLLAGWGIALSNFAAIIPLPLFIVYMNHFQIEPEERILAARFGQQFGDYSSRVRRWL